MTEATSSLPGEITITGNQVFPGDGKSTAVFFDSGGWPDPITYFVGRNGSGKSRTARLVANGLGGHFLSTDRLAGLMSYNNYGWTSVAAVEQMRGIPINDQERAQARAFSQQGSGVDEMYALREQPEVWLNVAAFIRRALGRVIELRESAGLLDPFVRINDVEYSLLREEGHGLRELVLLLTALYRQDWQLLVVDEPELHVHPSMSRLWLSELDRVCRARNQRAIIVTHEPSMVKPTAMGDLRSLWLFKPGANSAPMSTFVPSGAADRVTASLTENPQLVSQLVFSPRPVLVEGIHDVAALTVASNRTQPSEVVAQTDFIECGGSGQVALWFEISRSAGLDVRAVADLDACLAPEVQRVMDSSVTVQERYRTAFMVEPPETHRVVRPLIEAMNAANVGTDAKSRAQWLATGVPAHSGWESRWARFQEAWREEGFWLHSQGTLEDVLGLSQKGVKESQAAAALPGDIDAVADWCAYDLDPLGDVEILLGVAVEKIAHGIMEALRTAESAEFRSPVGPSADIDARLVQIEPLGSGVHRLTVVRPEAFVGYWLDFSRETPSSELVLKRPM